MKIVHLVPDPASRAVLTGYLHEELLEQPHRSMRPCVVICPGGAYRRLSPNESDPVALSFFVKGYQAFILRYSTAGMDDPEPPPLGMLPLVELSRALCLLRERGEELQIIPDQIGVMGFSAGGHLAASLGALWDSRELARVCGEMEGKNRPNALMLCYPVITAGEFAHRDSFTCLTGHDPGLDSLFSLETRVTEHTPPTFLWHTGGDELVPLENALLFALALRRAGVPMECHFYEKGPHALSLATPETAKESGPYIQPHCATWFPLCVDWLNTRFDFSA